jgi:hypothetical protein
MRFRMGLGIGFAAGYWFGTAAGRERHEQLKQMVAKVKRSDAFETATEKTKAAVDLTVERAKDVIQEHTPLGGKDSDLATANGTPVRP